MANVRKTTKKEKAPQEVTVREWIDRATRAQKVVNEILASHPSEPTRAYVDQDPDHEKRKR